MIDHLPILIIIIPMMLAFLILLFKKYGLILAILSISFSLSSLFILIPIVFKNAQVVYNLGNWEGPHGISLVIDGLSLFFSLAVLVIGLLALIYTAGDKQYNHTYYFLFLLLISSMIGTIFTADIFNMYILYDIVTISTYLLIAYHQQGIAIRASFNYLLMSAVGLSLFLLAVGSLYAMSGTLQISLIAEQVPEIFLRNPRIIIISLALIITAMGIKMSMVPLHSWLPDAHSLAPSPVSALLSGVVVKVGVYCLIRLSANLFSLTSYLLSLDAHHILMLFGVITLVFGAIMALTQDDLKRMLAYSTINQIGLILIGFSINSSTGMEGALFHVLNHALLKSGLFFCAGIIIVQSGTRKIEALAGYAERNSLVSFSFILFALGIIGIPPMNGFISKFLICLAAVEAEYPLIAVIVVTTSLITAAYYFRVIQIFYSQPMLIGADLSITNSKSKEDISMPIGIFQILPIYVLVVISFLLGILPNLGIYLAKPAIKILLSGNLP